MRKRLSPAICSGVERGSRHGTQIGENAGGKGARTTHAGKRLSTEVSIAPTSPSSAGRRSSPSIGAAFAATLVGASAAATAVAPNNTAEPRITGEPRVGQVQRATRGTWTGTAPISYEFRWYRCDGRGAADASDCTRISNASDNTYVARQGDSGFRLRVQVIGRNADGQDTATSNPTAVISSAGPTNRTEPSITGTATVGSTLQANRGRVVGPAAHHVQLRVAALQRAGRQLQRDPGCERHGVRGSGLATAAGRFVSA